MGVSGLLERHIITGVSLFVSIILLVLYRKNLVSICREIRNVWEDIRLRILRHPLLATGFIFVAVLVGLRMLAHVWFLSPYVWDTLTYHLPKVADWVQYGKLVALPTPVTRSYWPANFELVQTWFVLFFHHDFLIEAAGLPFYLLAILGVYSTGRSLDFSKSWSASLAVMYGLTPSVLMNAVSCKNDIAMAALYLFVLAVMLDFRMHGDRVGSHAAVIASAILMAVGTKPYMVFILPGLILIGLWCYQSVHTGINKTKDRDNAFFEVCFLLVAALILGTYWYARNYRIFGNPFYPVDFHLFGHLAFGGGQGGIQQGGFRWESLLSNLLDLAGKKIFDPSGPYDPDLSNKSGWGWFVFSCGIPAFIFSIIKGSQIRWLIIGFLISLASLFAMVSPDPWNMRFTLWFPAVFALAYGLMTSRSNVKFLKGCLILLAGGCSALNLLGCIGTGYFYRSPSTWQSQAAIPVWERTFLPENIKPALQKIPPNENLAYFARGDDGIYPLYGPEYTRKIYYLKPHKDMDIVHEMKGRGVRYFLLVGEGNASWLRTMDNEIQKGHMRRIVDRLYCLTEVGLN